MFSVSFIVENCPVSCSSSNLKSPWSPRTVLFLGFHPHMLSLILRSCHQPWGASFSAAYLLSFSSASSSFPPFAVQSMLNLSITQQLISPRHGRTMSMPITLCPSLTEPWSGQLSSGEVPDQVMLVGSTWTVPVIIISAPSSLSRQTAARGSLSQILGPHRWFGLLIGTPLLRSTRHWRSLPTEICSKGLWWNSCLVHQHFW